MTEQEQLSLAYSSLKERYFNQNLKLQDFKLSNKKLTEKVVELDRQLLDANLKLSDNYIFFKEEIPKEMEGRYVTLEKYLKQKAMTEHYIALYKNSQVG